MAYRNWGPIDRKIADSKNLIEHAKEGCIRQDFDYRPLKSVAPALLKAATVNQPDQERIHHAGHDSPIARQTISAVTATTRDARTNEP